MYELWWTQFSHHRATHWNGQAESKLVPVLLGYRGTESSQSLTNNKHVTINSGTEWIGRYQVTQGTHFVFMNTSESQLRMLMAEVTTVTLTYH
jgi:hypothetical protein